MNINSYEKNIDIFYHAEAQVPESKIKISNHLVIKNLDYFK